MSTTSDPLNALNSNYFSTFGMTGDLISGLSSGIGPVRKLLNGPLLIGVPFRRHGLHLSPVLDLR